MLFSVAVKKDHKTFRFSFTTARLMLEKSASSRRGAKVFTSRVVSLPRRRANSRLLARLHKDIITHSLAPNGIKSVVVFRLSQLHLSVLREMGELKRLYNTSFYRNASLSRGKGRIEYIINFQSTAFAQSCSFTSCSSASLLAL